MKTAYIGSFATQHWQTSPKHYIKETCLTCHGDLTEKQAKYVMESLHARVQGKTRKAEFWLTRMIDKYEEARSLGVGDDVLGQARDRHTTAHQLWEWWTASNGHAFHNPEGSVASLNKSIATSQEGIKILDDAMAARRKAVATAAAPAAAPAAPPAEKK